jgi:hypothetical protein
MSTSMAARARRGFGAPVTGPGFRRVIGVDYSGAGKEDKTSPAITAWVSDRKGTRPLDPLRRWSRDALTDRLAEELAEGPVLVAIDHAFAYSVEVLDRLGVRRWDDLPKRLEGLGTLDRLREAVDHTPGWRLTDRWAPGTQDPLGIRTYRPVSHSTFKGIRQLGRLRAMADFHLWPFDGWEPAAGGSVVAEGFPYLVRRRVPTMSGHRDEQDAAALAAFLGSRDRAGLLSFRPPLTPAEARQARREGWILGLS